MEGEGRRDSVRSAMIKKGESRGSSRRRRLFWKLRQRWKLLGLFEIDKDHEFYPLTCDLKEGLRDAVQDTNHTEASQPILTDEDYGAKLTQGHEEVVFLSGIRFNLTTVLSADTSIHVRNCPEYKQIPIANLSCSRQFLTWTEVSAKSIVVRLERTTQLPLEHTAADKYWKDNDFKIKGYVMRTYAGPVFKYFRQSLGISEESYQRSLSSCGLYLQFISNSKSKADFFLTNDKRLFLKTQSKREVHFLLQILRKYVQHFQSYPHSLLVKILGAYSITRTQEKKKYFIIMQSVFFPDERITGRYDIKGCHVSRWTEPELEGSRVLQVFKDLNFEGNVICLDQQRSWLIRQTELDTRFLQDLNVLDYSLLVGFQTLHQDEKNQSWSLANLIVRTKRSVNGTGSPTTSQCASIPGTVEEESESTEEGTEFSDTPDVTSGRRVPMKKIGQQFSTVSDISEVMAQNRRLLPNYKNPLHVMDGPEMRYFIGIIDIFTVYGLKKRLEHLWKSMRYHGQEFSTVSPSRYAQRLCHWVETHTV